MCVCLYVCVSATANFDKNSHKFSLGYLLVFFLIFKKFKFDDVMVAILYIAVPALSRLV